MIKSELNSLTARGQMHLERMCSFATNPPTVLVDAATIAVSCNDGAFMLPTAKPTALPVNRHTVVARTLLSYHDLLKLTDAPEEFRNEVVEKLVSGLLDSCLLSVAYNRIYEPKFTIRPIEASAGYDIRVVGVAYK